MVTTWCAPLFRLLALIKPLLGWKHNITNNGRNKTIAVFNAANEQIYDIEVKKTRIDEDQGQRKWRTRMTFRVVSIHPAHKLPYATTEMLEDIVDRMATPRLYIGDLEMDHDFEGLNFTIGTQERAGGDGREELSRDEQEKLALSVYNFFRVILGFFGNNDIPLVIPFNDWNKPNRKRSASAMERGMGGAALDTESDNEDHVSYSTEEDGEEQHDAVQNDMQIASLIPGQDMALVNDAIQALRDNIQSVQVVVAPVEVKEDVVAPVEVREDVVDLTLDDPAPAVVQPSAPVVKSEFVDLT